MKRFFIVEVRSSIAKTRSPIAKDGSPIVEVRSPIVEVRSPIAQRVSPIVRCRLSVHFAHSNHILRTKLIDHFLFSLKCFYGFKGKGIGVVFGVRSVTTKRSGITVGKLIVLYSTQVILWKTCASQG